MGSGGTIVTRKGVRVERSRYISLNWIPGFGSVQVYDRPEVVCGDVKRACSKWRCATATLSMWTKV